MAKITVKSLLVTEAINKNSALKHEIISAGDHKFRIVMDVHNGSTRTNTSLSILLPDGTWGYVVNAALLNIELFSYVCSDNAFTVNSAWTRVRNAFINYIKVVYT